MVVTGSANPRSQRFRHVVFKGHDRARPIASGGGGSPPVHFLRTWLPDTRPIVPPLPTAGELSREEMAFVGELFQRVGLNATAYRPETLARRLPACLRQLRATGIRHARLILDKSPALAATAMESAVIGVSAFFRDTPVFNQFAYEVLSPLAGRRAFLRIWSAGCSEGQELYSIAMLLAEINRLGGTELLGTDCRAGAIARARDASYDDEVVRDIPPVLRQRYLERYTPTQHRLTAPIRRSVQWRQADVTRSAEAGPWDLILCRNMVMYLQPDAAGAVWRRLELTLRPGGFLIVGKAERPTGSRHLVPHGPCIYRKVA